MRTCFIFEVFKVPHAVISGKNGTISHYASCRQTNVIAASASQYCDDRLVTLTVVAMHRGAYFCHHFYTVVPIG